MGRQKKQTTASRIRVERNHTGAFPPVPAQEIPGDSAFAVMVNTMRRYAILGVTHEKLDSGDVRVTYATPDARVVWTLRAPEWLSRSTRESSDR